MKTLEEMAEVLEFTSVRTKYVQLMEFTKSSSFSSPEAALLWAAPRIATSGQVQRHSGFEWLCKHNRAEPIGFVRLDSEHAQSDRKSVNRGLPVLNLARGQGQRS